MRIVNEILLPDERQLGMYQVQIARHTAFGWTITIPPLHAIVTNYRLILTPQTRRPYPPASIPRAQIVRIYDVALDRWRGIRLQLHSGHIFHLILTSGQTGHFLSHFGRKSRLTRRPQVFIPRLPRPDVMRMISRVQHL